MALHARGVPAYAGIATSLAAPDEEDAAAEEVSWALHHASREMQEILRRLPPVARPAGELGVLISALESQVRG
jgi:hypothetical protein